MANPSSTAAPRLALDPAREQLDPHLPARQAAGALQVAEQGAHRREVLFGQHLGRHHERALVPALHGGEQRGERDDRLARADVALEEPVHRERTRHVGDDHRQRLALGAGELVGQAGEESCDEGPGHGARHLPGRHVVAERPGVGLERAPAQDERELQAEQLVEHEAPPGAVACVERFGQVDAVERIGPSPQVERCAPLLGEWISKVTGPLEGFFHE